MPKQIYKKNDSYFWMWWENIYKKELDNFQRWKNPLTIPDPDSTDSNRRLKLQAYYYGLCDGRKRINEGPD
jgi:hypothetical protein